MNFHKVYGYIIQFDRNAHISTNTIYIILLLAEVYVKLDLSAMIATKMIEIYVS